MASDYLAPTLEPQSNALERTRKAEKYPDWRHPRNDGLGPRPAIGPYSRALHRGAAGPLNGNSREAKFMKAYEAMLVEHVGGSPSAVQRALITRATRLACHLELWDARTLPEGGAFTATGHNHYLAWNNALVRTLARLGLEPQAAKPPSIYDLFPEQAAADDAA
jgi:hypothetical protein